MISQGMIGGVGFSYAMAHRDPFIRFNDDTFSDDDMEADAREVLREERRRYIVIRNNSLLSMHSLSLLS